MVSDPVQDLEKGGVAFLNPALLCALAVQGPSEALCRTRDDDSGALLVSLGIRRQLAPFCHQPYAVCCNLHSCGSVYVVVCSSRDA
jgi:hypothetical protein